MRRTRPMRLDEIDDVLRARYRRGGLIVWEELPDGLRITPEKHAAWIAAHPGSRWLPAPQFFARSADARYCRAAVPRSWEGCWCRCSQLAWRAVERRDAEGHPPSSISRRQRQGCCEKHGTPLETRPELDPEVLAELWAELDPTLLLA